MSRLGGRGRHLGTAGDVALLLGLVVVFFWGVLVTRQYYIPYDLIDQHYIFSYFVTDALKHGEAPFWTPYLFSGYPAIGDPLYAMFYPLNVIMYLLSPDSGLPYLWLEWQSALHYFIAGASMYALARTLSLGRLGSLVAAIAFTFGGFFVTHAPHLSAISTLSWFPLILLLFNLALNRRSAAFALFAGVVYGIAILAGHAQATLHIFYILFAFLLFRLYAPAMERKYREVAASILLFGVTITMAFGLSAVQLLPSYEFGQMAGRTALSYQAASLSSLMPQHLITLIIPNFFGYDGPGRYWAWGDRAETYQYMGILTLVLAGFGVLFLGHRRAIVFGGFGLFSLLMAMGSWSALFWVAYLFLPGFDMLRRPYNFIIFFEFAVALLAGYGARHLIASWAAEQLPRVKWFLAWLKRVWFAVLVILLLVYLGLVATFDTPNGPLFTTVVNGLVMLAILLLSSIVLVFGCANRWWRPELLSILVISLLVLDVFGFGSHKVFNTQTGDSTQLIGPFYAYDPTNDIIRFLRADTDQWKNNYMRVDFQKAGRVFENGGNVWKLASIGGYNVLELTDYSTFRKLLDSYNSRLFDFLAVKYVVSPRALTELDPKVRQDKFELVFDQFYKVYRNKEFLPRAFVVYEAKVVTDQDQVLRALTTDGFDPGKTVVLEEDARAAAADVVGSPGEGAVNIEKYQPTKIALRAALSQPGFLVMSEVYYPGWKALVDGSPAKIYRANYAFRAIKLDAGEHTVTMVFDPPLFRAGLWVSGGTIAVLVAGLASLGAKDFWDRRRGRTA